MARVLVRGDLALGVVAQLLGRDVGAGSVPVGGAIKEIGSYVADDANTWAVKAPFIEDDGDFHMYGNDINRGFDVYRFDAQAPRSESTGTFSAPAAKAATGVLDAAKGAAGAATAGGGSATAAKLSGDRRLVCLLPRAQRRGR